MSNIKERVLLIAEHEGIRKVDFFKDLGLSYANFKGMQKGSALSSDSIVMILSKYPNIDPEWLVTGNGDMLRTTGRIAHDKAETYESPFVVNEIEQTLIEVLKMVISSQEKTIQSLERQVAIMEEELSRAKKKD